MSLNKVDILRQLDDLKGKLPLIMTNRGRVIYDRCIEKLKEFFNSVEEADVNIDLTKITEWDPSLDNNLYRVVTNKILQYLRGEIPLEVLGKGRKSRKKSKVTEFVLDEDDSLESDDIDLEEVEDKEDRIEDFKVIRSDKEDKTGFVDITKGGDNMRPQEKSILTLEDKVRIYQRDKYGRLITIGDYTVKEITPEGDLEAFLNNYVVPIYGGGIYEIYKILSNGQLKHIRSFRFADKDDKEEVSFRDQVVNNTEINTIKELLYRMLEKTMTLKDEDPTTWFARYRLIREIMKDFERVEKSNDYKYIDGIVDKLKELEAEIKQKQQVVNTGLDANTLIMRDLISDLINAVKDLKEAKREKEPEIPLGYDDFNFHDRQYIDDKLEDFKKEVKEALSSKTDWGAIIQALSPVLVEVYRSKVETDKMNAEKMDKFFELMMTQYAKTTELILSLYNSNGHNKYLYEFVNSFKDELSRIREEVKESLNVRNESARSLKDILEEIKMLKEVSGLINNTGEGMLDKIVKLIDRAPKIIETISSLSGMNNLANVNQLPNLEKMQDQRPVLIKREPTSGQDQANLIQNQMHNIILNILKELKTNKPELMNEFKGYLYHQDGTVNQEGVKLILKESGIDYDDNMLGQLYKVLQDHQKEYVQILEN